MRWWQTLWRWADNNTTHETLNHTSHHGHRHHRLAQQMPYNPDANGDDFVGVDDVLGVLGVTLL